MIEAQAAARVDRLDQDRDVVILRYIVKDSIEEVFPDSCPSTPSLISRLVSQESAKAQALACEAFNA